MTCAFLLGMTLSLGLKKEHKKVFQVLAHLRKEEYKGDILLIGINYSPKTKAHTCRIEKIMV